MRRLLLIRFALRELVIPLLVCLAGLAWGTFLLVTGQLAYWHLPLLAGMIGTPLVAIGGSKESPPSTPPGLDEALEELEQEARTP